MQLNIFHKAGTVFLGLAFLLFIAYFVIAAGGVSITAEAAGQQRWKSALRKVIWFVVFIAVMSYANLLPAGFEQSAQRILDAGLDVIRPIARKIPFVNGFL